MPSVDARTLVGFDHFRGVVRTFGISVGTVDTPTPDGHEDGERAAS